MIEKWLEKKSINLLTINKKYMADEEEQRKAQDHHERSLALLRDLRGDAVYRIDAIITNQASRRMDDASEEQRERSWIRGELVSLQRRIDQTISSL
jgi:hypothetical protein